MRRVWLIGVVCVACWGACATTVYEVYRVQPGDTVDSISRRYGMKPDELKDLNPFLLTGTLTENELITVMVRQGETAAVGLTSAPAKRKTPGATFNGDNGAGTISGAAGAAGAKVIDGDAPDGQAEGDEAGGRPAVKDPGEAVAAPTTPSGIRKSFAVNGAVGRLGLVTAEQVSIHRERSASSRVLYSCQRDARLAITQQVDDWFAVMMVDRSTGWVDSHGVSLTTTELVPSQPTAASGRGQQILREAYRYLGVPYVWGGEGFGGIDCSGLVMQSYRSVGIRLPRVAREQFTVGQAVPWDQLQAGDRIYFASDGRRIDHTGMYIGNGMFIHASGRKRQVTTDHLFDTRYWSIYVGARR